MTSFARPEPLGEAWLPRRPFEAPWLEERLAWWREREESFRRFAPFDLEEPGPAITREARGLCECWLPVNRILREARALVRAHFGIELEGESFARSWLDARRALASLPPLPSTFLAALADGDRAEALAFEVHDPAGYGHAFDRYPEAIAEIAALRPRRVWDAGCGTGETTFDLARVAEEVVGTTPWWWELQMARRRGRPHDRARTVLYRARTEALTNVRFEKGDVRRSAPGDGFDVIFIGGVLGGVLPSVEDSEAALRVAASALARGGTLLVVDRFREDRHERARTLVDAAAKRAALISVPSAAARYLRAP